MSAKPCMGGWCRRREFCSHYLAKPSKTAAQRLCEPGRDGVMRSAIDRRPAPAETTTKQEQA